MDVAELRAIYTATSVDFDRVTDHVQRRLKETQTAAGGVAGASQTVANEVKKIETTLTSRAPVRFLGIDVAREKAQVAEVANVAKSAASEVQQATSKVDSVAAASLARFKGTAKATATETKQTVASVGATLSTAERASARTTSTLIRDAKTGATITRAELAKIIGSGSKAVEAEAVKVGSSTSKILGDLRRLFLQNNFLFRQLGQRVAGDAGFAAVGVGKLALNFGQLAAGSGGAAAELEGAASAATSALGVFGPLGIAVGVAAVGFVAVEIAAAAAGIGLFLVAKSVADTEQHFEDLSRQTGLSTDNLQALDITTRQAGTTLDKFVGSVGQLQRKLIDASEGGTSRLSVGLRKLGIDLDDPNVALNQLIDLLIKLPAGTVRTGAAMQIFGRGGRDVAGVIDQIAENVGTTDGALDRLKKQFIDAGVHIDKDGTQTAAKFNDQWVKIEAQFESVKRVVGEEALPTVLRVATQFSNWLARNRVEIADWAKQIEHAAEALVRVGIALGKLASFTGGIFIPIIGVVRLIGPRTAIDAVSEVTKGVAGAITGQPTLPGSRFSPVAAGRRQPAGPQQFEPAGEVPQPLVNLPSPFLEKRTKEQADRVAKQIRDAFGRTGGGGGRGGHGEDPAQTARRLAEISLQETLKGLQAEHDALQRQLDQNLTSRNQYTRDAINLELERRRATIAGLQEELAAAEKIRKPGQRAIAVAAINARINDEERRSAKEVEQITDESAAEQLRIGQALADSQLRVVETQTDQVKARIREQADFRVITEQQATEFEEKQTLRVFNARERILRQERDDARLSGEKRAESQNKFDELDAERRAFLEGSSRRIAESIRSDAEHVIQFAAQIRDAFQRAADVRLEAGEANLEPLRNSILTRHQLWDAELQFEITREEQRHDAVVAGFEDEEKRARNEILNARELAQRLATIRAQTEAEEELHQARLKQLATQAAEQRRQELLQVADDLASIASDIFDAIGKSSEEFWASLKQSATSFAKQIRDELFKGLLEKLITGQAQGAGGLIGAIINPLLGGRGPNAGVTDNTKATQANTAAINALTGSMGGVPTIEGGLSGVLQLIPGLFGGGRATGGPVDAGRIYQVHDNEFFRPNVSGKIYNLDQMSAALNQQSSGEVRTIVALGDHAVGEAIESHRLTPQGRRAQIVRGRWNRKTGGLQFA